MQVEPMDNLRMKSGSRPAKLLHSDGAEAPDWSQRATITPLALRALLAVLLERGVDVERLCLGSGVTPHQISQPTTLVSLRQCCSLIRRSLAVTRDPQLGLEVGKRESLTAWGLVGFGMMACPTAESALHYALAQQANAGAMLDFESATSGRETWVRANMRLAAPDLEPFMVDEAFASQLVVARQLLQARVRPVRVELRHSRRQRGAYLEFFDCSMHFEADFNRIVYPSQLLAQPIAEYHFDVASHIHAQIENALPKAEPRDELIESVRRDLSATPGEVPNMGEVASGLNLSERTLRRSLAAHGTSYSRLADDLRREAVLTALFSGQSLSAIATHQGFADWRALKRAFKRWTGQTPRRWLLTQANGRESDAVKATEGRPAIEP
ncbi:MAG: AraC family transcriptional regulator [Rubrivivax sp.]|jgi:AraC-like DNA-binding protein|nr:AraC family transcriptional regulator [Rubrivivax sp.]